MRVVVFVAFVFLTASCTEVSFPTHQPKGTRSLPEFPTALQGRYISADTSDLHDTLTIDRNTYYFSPAANQNKSWLDRGVLSDSLVLKKYKGLYFINFYEEEQWLLRVLKAKANGDLQVKTMIIDGPGKDELLWELRKELPVETIVRDSAEKYYRIDPSPSQLIKLLKRKKYWEEGDLIRVK